MIRYHVMFLFHNWKMWWLLWIKKGSSDFRFLPYSNRFCLRQSLKLYISPDIPLIFRWAHFWEDRSSSKKYKFSRPVFWQCWTEMTSEPLLHWRLSDILEEVLRWYHSLIEVWQKIVDMVNPNPDERYLICCYLNRGVRLYPYFSSRLAFVLIFPHPVFL